MKLTTKASLLVTATSLTGCAMLNRSAPVTLPDVAHGLPSQVRYVGVQEVENNPSRIMKSSKEQQFVLTTQPVAQQTTKQVKPDFGTPIAAPVRPATPLPSKTVEIQHGSIQVLFGFDSSALTNDAVVKLDALLPTLRAATEIEIVGHTDSRGPDSYNQVLSLQRGNAVKSHLEGRGIDRAKMHVRGEGERHPATTNKTESGRAQNRRVVITY